VVLALDRQERGRGAASAVQELEQQQGLQCVSIVTLADLIEALSRPADGPARISPNSFTALRAYQQRLRRHVNLPAARLAQEYSRMSARARRPDFAGCLLHGTSCVLRGAAAAPSSKQGIAYRWSMSREWCTTATTFRRSTPRRERAILNSQGVEVGHLDAQKIRSKSLRVARERATQMRQRQHDAFLITTYTSVKDIEALRDRRLDQMKGQRAAASSTTESLRTRLASLQSRR